MAKLTVRIAAFGSIAIGAWSASAANAQSLLLSSPDIKEGGTVANEQVFKGFGCTGGNISPALSWSGAPSGTKSFAVTIYDPDAPTGSGWWHWVVFNVPAGTASLPKGAGDAEKKLMPKGADPKPHRFRQRRLWRSVPTGRRQAASLPDYGFRGGRRQAAGRQERCGLGGTGRLRPAFPYPGEGDVDRSLRPLKGSIRNTTRQRSGRGSGRNRLRHHEETGRGASENRRFVGRPPWSQPITNWTGSRIPAAHAAARRV